MNPGEIIKYPLLAVGGTETGFAIGVPPKGTLTKVIVSQLSGTLAGFTYTFYNFAGACPPGPNPSTVAAAAGIPARLYQVMGPVTVPAGSDYFASAEQWPNDGVHGVLIPYVNLDTTGFQGGKYEPYLYLKLNVAGTGNKQFGIALTPLATQF